jgi:hypothetical protein
MLLHDEILTTNLHKKLLIKKDIITFCKFLIYQIKIFQMFAFLKIAYTLFSFVLISQFIDEAL